MRKILLFVLLSISCPLVYGHTLARTEIDSNGNEVYMEYEILPDGSWVALGPAKASPHTFPTDEEIVSIREKSSGDFRVKYKNGRETRYVLTKDGRLCKDSEIFCKK